MSQGVESNGSGSEVGNVIYEHIQIIITDTGSYQKQNKYRSYIKV